MHQHSHGKALGWSTAVTLAFVVFELAAGLGAHSLALISDSGHNFTDALALILAAAAQRLESRPADDRKTYGYQRAGVLAAFINALALLAISAIIFWEAWFRLFTPPAVNDTTMGIVALAGIAVNVGIMMALHRGRHDLNIRAAWVHMLGDAVSSAAIVAGAVVIRFTGWHRIDPALSICIGVLIIWTAWDIIRESLNVLLEGIPQGMNLKAISNAVQTVPGVIDVHDLHVWTLGAGAHALSCHVLIDDMPPSESHAILLRINEALCAFHIHHSTVQFEHVRCALSDAPCSMLGGAHQHPHTHSH